MGIFLRVIRAIAGFIFAMQVIGIAPALIRLGSIDGAVAGLLMVKVLVGAVFALVFFSLRRPINAIYEKKDLNAPKALKTKWSL